MVSYWRQCHGVCWTPTKLLFLPCSFPPRHASSYSQGQLLRPYREMTQAPCRTVANVRSQPPLRHPCHGQQRAVRVNRRYTEWLKATICDIRGISETYKVQVRARTCSGCCVVDRVHSRLELRLYFPFPFPQRCHISPTEIPTAAGPIPESRACDIPRSPTTVTHGHDVSISSNLLLPNPSDAQRRIMSNSSCRYSKAGLRAHEPAEGVAQPCRVAPPHSPLSPPYRMRALPRKSTHAPFVCLPRRAPVSEMKSEELPSHVNPRCPARTHAHTRGRTGGRRAARIATTARSRLSNTNPLRPSVHHPSKFFFSLLLGGVGSSQCCTGTHACTQARTHAPANPRTFSFHSPVHCSSPIADRRLRSAGRILYAVQSVLVRRERYRYLQ